MTAAAALLVTTPQAGTLTFDSGLGEAIDAIVVSAEISNSTMVNVTPTGRVEQVLDGGAATVEGGSALNVDGGTLIGGDDDPSTILNGARQGIAAIGSVVNIGQGSVVVGGSSPVDLGSSGIFADETTTMITGGRLTEGDGGPSVFLFGGRAVAARGGVLEISDGTLRDGVDAGGRAAGA